MPEGDCACDRALSLNSADSSLRAAAGIAVRSFLETGSTPRRYRRLRARAVYFMDTYGGWSVAAQWA